MINIMQEFQLDAHKEHKIKISKKKFKKYKDMALAIEKESKNHENTNQNIKFHGRNHYPTVSEMLDHNVENNLKKYLPTLIFYDLGDIDDGSEDYKQFKSFVKYLFDEYLVIVDNEVVLPIINLTKKNWDSFNLKEKTDIFKPLIDYYDSDEFGVFLCDLGWQKFMRMSKYSKKNFVVGYMPNELVSELKRVWDCCKK